MIPIAVLFAASLSPATAAPPAGRSGGGRGPGAEAVGDVAWRGVRRGPDLGANGAFERRHYGPDNQTLSGTWKVRWDALPPTLVLTSRTRSRGEIGTVQEVKLVRLDDVVFAYLHGGNDPARYTHLTTKKK